MITALLAALHIYYLASLLILWLPIIRARRAGYCSKPASGGSPAPVLVITIPCKDGAASIPGLMKSLSDQDYHKSKIRVVVLADNCMDNSADIAREHGAEVYERKDSFVKTKGAALNEWLSRIKNDDFDALVILDVDSRPNKSFLSEVAVRIRSGALVTQAALYGGNSHEGAFARIGELTHAIDRLQQQGRSASGFPALLLGSGCALHRKALQRLHWKLSEDLHLSEDAELTLRCALAGIQIVYAPEQCVFNDMPVDARAIRIQRSRWNAGRLELLGYARPMFARIMRGDWHISETAFYVILLPPVSVFFACWSLWTLLLFLPFEAPALVFWRSASALLWMVHAAWYARVLSTVGFPQIWEDRKSFVTYMAMRLAALLEAAGLVFRARSGGRWITTAHLPSERNKS